MDKRYALRCEAPIDILLLVDACRAHGVVFGNFEDFKDSVSFASDATIDALLAVIETVPDGHVMFQTLQPIETYTGKRDYERERTRADEPSTMTREEMKKAAYIMVLGDDDTFTGLDGCWFAYTSPDQVAELDEDGDLDAIEIKPCDMQELLEWAIDHGYFDGKSLVPEPEA
jgi:hypothetical protein